MHVHARVTVRAQDAELIIEGLRGSGLDVADTGERVMTDDGPEGEYVLSVGIPATIDVTTQAEGTSEPLVRLAP